MVKSRKVIYSKLNYIYIPSGRALKMYFLYSLYSLLRYIFEIININPLARVLLAFSLSCSLVFISIECVCCCAILTQPTHTTSIELVTYDPSNCATCHYDITGRRTICPLVRTHTIKARRDNF